MLTQARLREVVTYNKRTGVFRARVDRGRARRGDVLGRIDTNGYRGIVIDKVLYYAHRLAFMYVLGRWPVGICDHRNRQRDNNRWTNLRDATYQNNAVNSKLQSNNTSGVRGVTWHADARKWMACIKVNGKSRYLGLYPSKVSARAAYREAAKMAFG